MIDRPTPLKTAQIIVRKGSRGWHMKWADSDRVFADEQAALNGAIDIAYANSKNGSPTCVVLLIGKTGTAKVVWRYGHDAYPPKLPTFKRSTEAVNQQVA